MKTEILGVGFDPLTLAAAAEQGCALLDAEGFHYAVTPNPEFLLAARRDGEFRAALCGADLTLADGIGVIYAANILGKPLPGRVPGIDFARALMTRLSERGAGTRVFLLGGKPGVAEEAARRLALEFPGITLCGARDGYFTDDAQAAAAVAAAGAQLLFVCLGAPKQETWMVRWGPATGCRLAAGLGGALDVFSGRVSRAPELWRRLGLEWAYRLMREPRRAGRMAKLPLVLLWAAARRLRGKGGKA